jgi:MEDS: MEthanogen/methylotroph, DcmR Sensory domain
MNLNKQQSVTLCGETLTGPLHICAFFDSREEQYEVLLPWIKEGIYNNEEVLNILESKLHAEHCSRLAKENIPVRESIESGQLKIASTEDTYLQGGAFAVDRMFNLVEQAVVNAQNGPYGMFRGCGEMQWALKNLPGTDQLMEYEARLNFLTPKYDCSIICIYDINKFSGRAVADILATHSHVILNGKIHKNPHFIEPIELLKILLKRPKRSLQGDNYK